MCDPTGFRFELPRPLARRPRDPWFRAADLPGDEVKFSSRARLVARVPRTCHIRLLSAGKVIAERSGDRLEFEVAAPGVYRVEGWLELGGEERGWVYSNPIYVR